MSSNAAIRPKASGRSSKADGSQYELYGSVSRDPRIGAIPKNNLPKVEFGMGYDSKQFMNVCAVGDNAATKLSACLEKGDAVCVVGTWRQKPYTTKEGEEKFGASSAPTWCCQWERWKRCCRCRWRYSCGWPALLPSWKSCAPERLPTGTAQRDAEHRAAERGGTARDGGGRAAALGPGRRGRGLRPGHLREE